MFTADDAWAIARKLGAHIREGRNHHVVSVLYNGRRIAQYGISRSSGSKGHDYLPKQLHMSFDQCRQFRKCDLSVDQYIGILKGKHLI